MRMFDVQGPVSPMLFFVWTDWEDAIYHMVVYNDDCDTFEVVKVLKFNIETWEPSD